MERFTRTFFVAALIAAGSVVASEGAIKIYIHGKSFCAESGGGASVTTKPPSLGEGGTWITCQRPRDAVGNDATAFDRAVYHLLF